MAARTNMVVTIIKFLLLQGDAPPQHSHKLEDALAKVCATCTSMDITVLLVPASGCICTQSEPRPRPMGLIANVL